MSKIRIGVVDYLNALPLIHGLDRERGIKIVREVPSKLSQKLQKKELDVALVSTIECFRHADFRILPDIGVCSEGPIRSVKLYSHGPLDRAERIALDTASCSAATLTRLVFREFFQKEEGVEFFDSKSTLQPESVDADAVLLIGDVALKADPGDMEMTDLGALWTDRTGLPFVYAVWMCRESISTDDVLPLLLRARDRGLPERPRIAQQASRQLGLPQARLHQYLTRNLRYQLGEREIKGLERFRDMAFEHELCNRHDVPFVGSRVQTVET